MFREDDFWRALSDVTRRAILDQLRGGPRTTGDLCVFFEPRLSRTGVMKHLGILEAAGLVLVRRQGRLRWNFLNPVPIQRICRRWVDRYSALGADALLRLQEQVEGTPNELSRRREEDQERYE